MAATPRDGAGNILSSQAIVWTSTNTGVATVTASGLVTGVSAGTTTISASSGGRTGSTTVTVTPLPVATVEVTPDPVQVIAGFGAQLGAILRDRNGDELSGRTIDWSTADPSIAAVDAAGFLTVSVGGTTVAATSERISGGATVEVSPQPPVLLSTVTPDPLIEGEAASLTGEGFSPVPGDNQVTVDGVEAVVTQATATTVDFIVPESACQPKRPVEVQVTVAAEVTNTAEVTARAADLLSMEVGDHVVLSDPSDLCLQFDESAAAERYIVGVQSVSEATESLTEVRVSSSAAPAAQVERQLPPTVPSMPALGLSLSEAEVQELARWDEHRRAEIAFRERSRPILAPLFRAAASRTLLPARTSPATIAGDVPVGTQLTLRFPGFDTSSCMDFTDIEVVVRKVSARAIMVEDLANPAGGFVAADFDDLGDDFDSTIYDGNVDTSRCPFGHRWERPHRRRDHPRGEQAAHGQSARFPILGQSASDHELSSK